MSGSMTFLMPDAETEVDVSVDRFDVYPRGDDGSCALCQGDPCSERQDKNQPETLIAMFWRINDDERYGARSCPFCDGRPI